MLRSYPQVEQLETDSDEEASEDQPGVLTQAATALGGARARARFRAPRRSCRRGGCRGLAHLAGTSTRSFSLRRGDHDGSMPGARGREHLLLDAADRQHPPAQRDLAGHRDVAARAPTREQRDQRRHQRDARRRPVLRHRARRHVQMDLARRAGPRREAERAAWRAPRRAPPRADSRITSPSWPVSRRRTPSPPGMRRGLDEEDVAAVRGRGESDGDAGHARCARRSPAGAAGRRGLRRRAASTTRRSRRRRVRAAAICGRALRISVATWRSRLRTPASRVYSWTTFAMAASVDFDLHRREPVRLELLRDEVLLRDRELLVFRVAGQLDHLHAVEQRRRDRARACSPSR